MNAKDILERGHVAVMRAADGLPAADWDTGGVCGVWSAKDVLSHLAAYEHVLAETLGLFVGDAPAPTPHLDEYRAPTGTFNDDTVALRKSRTPADVLDEYRVTHEATAALLERIPADKLREVGTIPWYDPQGSLDDLIVRYGFGHKREHAAQIGVYRDHIKR